MTDFHYLAKNLLFALPFLLLVFLLPSMAAHGEPLTLYKHEGTGIDLTVSGAHRTRFETLFDSSSLVSLRSTLLVEAGTERFRIGGELMDARAYGDQANSFSFFNMRDELNNTIEPIQYYLVAKFEDIFSEGLDVTLKGGRLTLDLGSGRLFGRNKFRNTINSFRGGQITIERSNQSLLLFYVNPMDIISDFARGQQMDVPITESDIAGLHYSNNNIFDNINGEAYFYAVKSNFGFAFGPRLVRYTPGFRLWRESNIGQLDFEIEITPQFRQHPQGFAYFVHADVGYSFDSRWRPHVSLLFDIASGDGKTIVTECSPEFTSFFPNCMSQLSMRGTSGFNSLYGRISDDFGPTGLFRSNSFTPFSFGNGRELSRRNIISPALRIKSNLSENLEAILTARGFWREDATQFVQSFSPFLPPDMQTVEVLPSEIGYQLDASVSYELLDGHLRFDVGGAVFFFGQENQSQLDGPGFRPDARLPPRRYLYTSLTANF